MPRASRPWRKASVAEIFDELVASLTDSGHEQYTLGAYTKGGGHSVVPYAVDRLEGGRAIIHYSANEIAARELAERVGPEHVHLSRADLTSVEQTESLWDDAVAWQGHIDVLINNAGVYERCPIELELNEWLTGWDRTLRINLLSAAQLCRHAVPHFRGRGGMHEGQTNQHEDEKTRCQITAD